jgi:pimeloyl-ACP methyl ester carboxylesterase
MEKVISKDGTPIAYDQLGSGPVVILISGGPNDRSGNASLADLLAQQFTVINYDRRGRGDSGDTLPYAVERELEDLDALIKAAGGSAFVYGTSSGAAFAIVAAAHGLNIKKLALWEPPFIIEGSRPPVPADYKAQLSEMVSSNRRGDAMEFFLTQIVGMPAEFVAPMRHAPFWGNMEKMAHVIVYEADVMGDYSLPTERLASISVPTIVIDGGQSSWMTLGAEEVAKTMPNAQRSILDNQPHNVDAAAIAPVIAQFFAS